MKKRILFLPTYRYLSSPCFTILLKDMNKYDTYYIDIKEYSDWGKTEESLKLKFTKYFSLKNNFDFNKFSNFKKIFKFLKFKKEIITMVNNIKPDLVITTSDMTRYIKVIDSHFDLPIFIIQPSFFDKDIFKRARSHDFYYIMFNNLFKLQLFNKQNNWGNELENATLFLWGDYFKKLINNYDRRKINVVGNINFDFLNMKYNSLKIRNRYRINVNKTIILICTDGLRGMFSNEYIDKLYNIYNSTIKKRKDLLFIVKPHPRETNISISSIIDGVSENAIVLREADLYELIEISDIQISAFSATSFESVVMNTPIILVNPYNLLTFNDYFNNEIEEKASTAFELMSKIDIILNSKYIEAFNKKREKYLNKMVYKLDHKASSRLIQNIEKELKE